MRTSSWHGPRKAVASGAASGAAASGTLRQRSAAQASVSLLTSDEITVSVSLDSRQPAPARQPVLQLSATLEEICESEPGAQTPAHGFLSHAAQVVRLGAPHDNLALCPKAPSRGFMSTVAQCLWLDDTVALDGPLSRQTGSYSPSAGVCLELAVASCAPGLGAELVLVSAEVLAGAVREALACVERARAKAWEVLEHLSVTQVRAGHRPWDRGAHGMECGMAAEGQIERWRCWGTCVTQTRDRGH